jgi:hypothetical protein
MTTCTKMSLGLALLLISGAIAHAQGAITQPTVTPWLNLYRGGNSVAMNYYNLVKPEFTVRGAIGQLQQQNNTNQQSITDLTTPAGPLVTGHAAGFMTQRAYFQTNGASAPGAIGTTAGFSTNNRPKTFIPTGSVSR